MQPENPELNMAHHYRGYIYTSQTALKKDAYFLVAAALGPVIGYQNLPTDKVIAAADADPLLKTVNGNVLVFDIHHKKWPASYIATVVVHMGALTSVVLPPNVALTRGIEGYATIYDKNLLGNPRSPQDALKEVLPA